MHYEESSMIYDSPEDLNRKKKQNQALKKRFHTNWFMGEDAVISQILTREEPSDSDLSSNDNSNKPNETREPSKTATKQKNSVFTPKERTKREAKSKEKEESLSSITNNSSDKRSIYDWYLLYGGGGNNKSPTCLKWEIETDLQSRIEPSTMDSSLNIDTPKPTRIAVDKQSIQNDKVTPTDPL